MYKRDMNGVIELIDSACTHVRILNAKKHSSRKIYALKLCKGGRNDQITGSCYSILPYHMASIVESYIDEHINNVLVPYKRTPA